MKKEVLEYASPFLVLRGLVKEIKYMYKDETGPVNSLHIRYITKTKDGLGQNSAFINVYTREDSDKLKQLTNKYIELEYAYARNQKGYYSLHLRKNSFAEIDEEDALTPNFFEISGTVERVIKMGIDLDESKQFYEFRLRTDDINLHGLDCVAFKEDTKNWMPVDGTRVTLELATRRLPEYHRVTGKPIEEIKTKDGKQLYKMRNVFSVEEVKEETRPLKEKQEFTTIKSPEPEKYQDIVADLNKVLNEELTKMETTPTEQPEEIKKPKPKRPKKKKEEKPLEEIIRENYIKDQQDPETSWDFKKFDYSVEIQENEKEIRQLEEDIQKMERAINYKKLRAKHLKALNLDLK